MRRRPYAVVCVAGTLSLAGVLSGFAALETLAITCLSDHYPPAFCVSWKDCRKCDHTFDQCSCGVAPAECLRNTGAETGIPDPTIASGCPVRVSIAERVQPSVGAPVSSVDSLFRTGVNDDHMCGGAATVLRSVGDVVAVVSKDAALRCVIEPRCTNTCGSRSSS